MKRLVLHSKTIIIYEEKSVFSGSKSTLARVEFEWKVGVSGVSGELWRGSQENKLWRLGRCWNWIEFLLTVKEGFCWEIFIIDCHPHDMNSGDTRMQLSQWKWLLSFNENVTFIGGSNSYCRPTNSYTLCYCFIKDLIIASSNSLFMRCTHLHTQWNCIRRVCCLALTGKHNLYFPTPSLQPKVWIKWHTHVWQEMTSLTAHKNHRIWSRCDPEGQLLIMTKP